MPSHRLKKITIDDLELIGYSVAAEENVIAIPQLDVCFDIGKAPDQVVSINHVLITHGHIDHSAGLAYYLSHRKFLGIKPGTILAPANTVGPIRQIIDAWGQLDGSRIPAEIIPVKPGDEFQIKPNLYARVFPTKHCNGSVGYTIIEKRKKLRKEYTKLTGPQIVELKKQGVEIDYQIEIPVVSYLGDTEYVDYSQLDYIANSKILITECTFYEDEHRGRSDLGKHIHVDELNGLLKAMNNQHMIITHATSRTPVKFIKQALKEKLDADIFEKTIFLMDPAKRAD